MPEATPEGFDLNSLWLPLGDTFVTVAIVVGIVIYIFGYYAGAKKNKAKVNMCIFLTTLLNFLAMPFAFKAYKFLSVMLTTTIGFILTVTIWMAFMVGVSVHMYEIFVVTAKEAHPEQ